MWGNLGEVAAQPDSGGVGAPSTDFAYDPVPCSREATERSKPSGEHYSSYQVTHLYFGCQVL